MQPLKETDPTKHSALATLFQDYRWNYLVSAVLEGGLGRAWVDDPQNIRLAALEFPKIQLSVLGGDASTPLARDFLTKVPPYSAFIGVTSDWEALLAELGVSPGDRVALQWTSAIRPAISRKRACRQTTRLTASCPLRWRTG